MDAPSRCIIFLMSAGLALCAVPAGAGDAVAQPACGPNGAGDGRAGEQAPVIGASEREGWGAWRQAETSGEDQADELRRVGSTQDNGVAELGHGGEPAHAQPAGARPPPEADSQGVFCSAARERRMHELLKSLLHWPVSH